MVFVGRRQGVHDQQRRLVHAEVAVSALAARLSDPESDVRLEALRALQRIDRGWLEGRAELVKLAADPDPRIARLADTLVAR